MLKRSRAMQISVLLSAIAAASAPGRAWAADPPASTQPARKFEMKRHTLSLDSIPGEPAKAFCVLRPEGKPAPRVLSVSVSDPTLSVSHRRDGVSGAYVVTAEFPAGYRVPDGQTVEVLVKTDLEDEPVLRIPVRVNTRPYVPSPQWLAWARRLVGAPAPFVNAERLLGGDLQIGAGVMGDKVTVLLFAAHWCDHCEQHVPAIEQVRRDYAARGQDEPQWIAILPTTGTGGAVEQAAERWGLGWTLVIDRGVRIATEYHVNAYPMVFLVGRDGTVESVLGRWSNSTSQNGLEHVAEELKTQIDILLAGGTRADFPVVKPASATRPASDSPTSRPAMEAATTRPATGGIGAAPPVNPPSAG